MMARASGPYSAAFPVNFTSNGDTTRDAFKKHMDEISRIYGLLTDFDKDIANTESTSGALSAHISSTNPHPNWKPSYSFSDITGTLPMSRVSGDLDASRVVGALSRATIDYSKVTGLSAFVDGKIPAVPTDKGDGITQSSKSANGYAKFNNGLIVQWGSVTVDGVQTSTYARGNFPIAFPNVCYSFTATGGFNVVSGNSCSGVQKADCYPQNNNFYPVDYRSSFCCYVTGTGSITVNYIAIGA